MMPIFGTGGHVLYIEQSDLSMQSITSPIIGSAILMIGNNKNIETKSMQ